MLERRFDVQIVCVRVYGSDESLRPPKCRPIMNRTGEAWPVWLATGWDVGADSYRRAKQERRRGEASIGVRTASPPSPGGGGDRAPRPAVAAQAPATRTASRPWVSRSTDPDAFIDESKPRALTRCRDDATIYRCRMTLQAKRSAHSFAVFDDDRMSCNAVSRIPRPPEPYGARTVAARPARMHRSPSPRSPRPAGSGD